jgi:hypothetical protein
MSCGDVAQLVEHLLCKQGVRGSSPLISKNEKAFVYHARAFAAGFAVERSKKLTWVLMIF